MACREDAVLLLTKIGLSGLLHASGGLAKRGEDEVADAVGVGAEDFGWCLFKPLVHGTFWRENPSSLILTLDWTGIVGVDMPATMRMLRLPVLHLDCMTVLHVSPVLRSSRTSSFEILMALTLRENCALALVGAPVPRCCTNML